MTELKPRNDKNQAHGLWCNYYTDGTLQQKGYYINNNQIGYFIGIDLITCVDTVIAYIK